MNYTHYVIGQDDPSGYYSVHFDYGYFTDKVNKRNTPIDSLWPNTHSIQLYAYDRINACYLVRQMIANRLNEIIIDRRCKGDFKSGALITADDVNLHCTIVYDGPNEDII